MQYPSSLKLLIMLDLGWWCMRIIHTFDFCRVKSAGHLICEVVENSVELSTAREATSCAAIR
jgi:hypothetical protein